MNTPKTSKTPYIVIAIIVVVTTVIYFYWNGTKTPASLTLEGVSGADQAVGAKVLNLLNEIKSLKIDNSFFNDVSYKTLRDYSVQIPTLPVGRANPFSLLPGESIRTDNR